MGGYQDEYEEDLDEYEDDEVEGERYEGYEDEYEEGYEEEEEDPQPPKEVQDYLVLRQRLKEEKRRQLKKELGTANSSSREKKNSVLKSNDNYGSFFGSSQPVIAQRVIQESKSLLENPHLLEKATKPKSMVTKSTVPDSVNSKSQATVQAPKVVNGVLKKVQMIKKIRDYSFLDSDDPEPPKAPPPPKSEARMAHSSERNKDFSSSNGRKAVPSHRDDRKSTPVNGQTRPNVGSHKQTLSDPRRQQLPGSNGTVAQHDRNRVSNKISNGTVAHDRSRNPNKISNGTVAPDRDRIPNKISSGPGRPMVAKSAPSKNPVGDKRVPMPATKSSTSLTHKTAPSRSQPSASKQQVPISKQAVRRPEELRKRESVSGRHEEELRKQKVLPKQAEELRKQKMLQKQAALRHDELRKQQQKVLPRQGAPGLKPKVTQPPPRSSVRPMAVDDQSRKRQRKPFDDEEEDPLKMIRSMFGYNPSRYRDDDDVSDMEANFEEIEREEKRSARIARKEDEEELRKIEEEERRERMRKEAKKRKLH